MCHGYTSSESEAKVFQYPIEMLWEENGDCEDATALYASIMEYMGFDVVVALMQIQPAYGESWGGHAIPLIRLDGFSGTYDGDGDGIASVRIPRDPSSPLAAEMRCSPRWGSVLG